MQALQNLEIFEIEVLQLLNDLKILDSLYFGGGTMLRLCHNLNRYSTDLDFWVTAGIDTTALYKKLKNAFSELYTLTDAANKKNTILFEMKSPKSLRSLKIEIRKEQHDFDWERKIAFSKFTNTQVTVKGLTLHQMMQNKIAASLSRKIIRDYFDIEFLFMRGIELPFDKTTLTAMLKIIETFKDKDFKVLLGSILDETDRKFYSENKFKLLREEIKSKIIFSTPLS